MFPKERFRTFLKYTASSVLSLAGYSFYVVVDTMVLARVSEHAIAALNIVIPEYEAVNAVGLLLASGGSVLYAIRRGEENKEDGCVYFSIALVLGMIIAAGADIAAVITRYPAARLAGADAETLPLAADYLLGYMLLMPFNYLFQIVSAFMRCDGAPRLAGVSSLLGSLANIALDFLFVFGFQWGMFGAAFATGLAPVISLCFCMPYFKEHKNGFHPVHIDHFAARLRAVVRLGFPSFIASAAYSVTLYVFNRELVQLGGDTALTAYGIMINLGVLFNCLIRGTAQGITPLFGDSWGRRDREAMVSYFHIMIVSLTAAFVFSYAVILGFRHFLIGIFNPQKDAELYALTVRGMRIYFIGSGLSGFVQGLCSFFVGAEKAEPSTLLSVLEAGVVSVPLVMVLPVWLGLDGVWWAYTLSHGIVLILGVVLYGKLHTDIFAQCC